MNLHEFFESVSGFGDLLERKLTDEEALRVLDRAEAKLNNFFNQAKSYIENRRGAIAKQSDVLSQ